MTYPGVYSSIVYNVLLSLILIISSKLLSLPQHPIEISDVLKRFRFLCPLKDLVRIDPLSVA